MCVYVWVGVCVCVCVCHAIYKVVFSSNEKLNICKCNLCDIYVCVCVCVICVH